MIHLVGLPHTSLDADKYSHCAFTAKAARWVRTMDFIGRDITVYWAGDSTTEPVTEFVSCMSEVEREGWFGPYDHNELPKVEWDLSLNYWTLFHSRALHEIACRFKPGDYVAFQTPDQPLIDACLKMGAICIEPAVGYEGLGRGTHAAFESYAWRHYMYGKHGYGDGRNFDTVIPNFLDPDQFEVKPAKPYALYMGRMTVRKGPHIAFQAAQAAGVKLIMAGAGGHQDLNDGTVYVDGLDPMVPIFPESVEYVGAVGPEERKKLLAEASAFICPTVYVEPFGTVHAEALMSGVPVLAPDFGVFTETLTDPHDGMRCPMFRDYVAGLELALDIDWQGNSIKHREDRAARAHTRFNMWNLAYAWQDWFDRLDSLRGAGWYAERDYLRPPKSSQ